MKAIVSAAAAAGILVSSVGVGGASAQVRAVRDLPGYRCMMLNVSFEQMTDRNLEVPVYSQPSASSPRLGEAGATVAARDPVNVQNGFVEVLFPNGNRGWIQQGLLKPWRQSAGVPGVCVPAQLSNGRLGFRYS